jgi:hypothetical protein
VRKSSVMQPFFILGSGLQGVYPMTEVPGGLARADEFSGESTAFGSPAKT